jgi:hypothetical protein
VWTNGLSLLDSDLVPHACFSSASSAERLLPGVKCNITSIAFLFPQHVIN